MSDAADSARLEADLREAARHLARHPLVAAERSPDEFRLIKRHDQRLDQWFTQRFGYRLQVTADTARLFKSTVSARRRPLRTATTQPRPFTLVEYRMLALTLAAVVAGPNVISLHDLVLELRSAAAEAGFVIGAESADRRALVTVLRWMISFGIATELHDRVDAYAADEQADAVLEIRPDRVTLLPLPVLARSETVEQLLDRSDARQSARSWMRAQLLEEPVVYRDDLTGAEWSELRRRLGEEAGHFDEMFGMHLEARAEGVMAVDPHGDLTDVPFPPTGTVGQAALLLADRLVHDERESLDRSEAAKVVAQLAAEHRRYWSAIADTPDRLTGDALELLADHRLVALDEDRVTVLPAAARYAVDVAYHEVPLL